MDAHLILTLCSSRFNQRKQATHSLFAYTRYNALAHYLVQPPGRFKLEESELQKALRCVRLQLYSPNEAVVAIAQGHLNKPWGSIDSKIPSSILAKDRRAVINTGQLCAREALADGETYVDATGVSPKLRSAFDAEAAALHGCATGLESAFERLG